jgi:hypothetical protein
MRNFLRLHSTRDIVRFVNMDQVTHWTPFYNGEEEVGSEVYFAFHDAEGFPQSIIVRELAEEIANRAIS